MMRRLLMAAPLHLGKKKVRSRFHALSDARCQRRKRIPKKERCQRPILLPCIFTKGLDTIPKSIDFASSFYQAEYGMRFAFYYSQLELYFMLYQLKEPGISRPGH